MEEGKVDPGAAARGHAHVETERVHGVEKVLASGVFSQGGHEGDLAAQSAKVLGHVARGAACCPQDLRLVGRVGVDERARPGDQVEDAATHDQDPHCGACLRRATASMNAWTCRSSTAASQRPSCLKWEPTMRPSATM